MFDTLRQDLRIGFRRLLRDRGFTATATLTLAVCLGATTALFAILNTLLLKPLPFPDSDRVLAIYNSYPGAGVERGDNSVPNFYDRQAALTALADLAMYRNRGVTLGAEGSVERVPAFSVTSSFFDLLGVRPQRGRTFEAADGEVGNERKVVLSHALWQRLFAGRDAAVGEELRINGVSYTVIGVMPRDFHFVRADAALWIPAAFAPAERGDDRRHSNSWLMIGRLKPEATVGQVQEQLNALNARLLEQFPTMKQALIDVGYRTLVTPLRDDLVRSVRPALYLLWGGVLCVLAIGVINLTNLALVRAQARAKEVGTRRSLGATPGRIVGQAITETLLLTLVGGALALLLAHLALAGLQGFGLGDLPRGAEIGIDARVVGALLAATALLGLAIGGAPLLGLARMNLARALREESRGGTSSRAARRARGALATAQVAFAFTLLVVAGVLAVSFREVLRVEPGFETRGVLTARVSLPAARYTDEPAMAAFAERLLEASRRSPGVSAAGVTTSIPFGSDYSDSVILPEGYRQVPGESLVSPNQLAVSEGTLEALRARLVSGRFFRVSDTAQAPRVVIVDQRLAKRFWPDQDAVGRRMYLLDDPQNLMPGPNTVFVTVVGVVGDMKLRGLVDDDGRVGSYFFPFAQAPERSFGVVLRTDAEPTALLADLRRQVTSLDPELPVFDARPLDERKDGVLLGRRVPMLLALAFAAVALFLAGLGVYGVLAVQVGQRTREIGIRMALGGTAGSISKMVVGESLKMMAAGLILGFAGVAAVSKALRGLLYEVGPMDLRVLAGVGALLGAIALLAAWGPARRARTVDPARALAD
jgi:predicted permease